MLSFCIEKVLVLGGCRGGFSEKTPGAPCHRLPAPDSSGTVLSLPKAELISDCAESHGRAGGDAWKKAEACREAMLELEPMERTLCRSRFSGRTCDTWEPRGSP